jgi:ATP10 protein
MNILPAILMASALVSPLTCGKPLPQLKGEFLTGREAHLPDAALGRIALLALGFTYNSRYPVEAWTGRFRKDFGSNAQVTFYEIPMISGMARLGKWFIDSGMRKGTPRSDQENVITVYGGTDSWKQRVGYTSPDAAYLVLLDKHGAVRWRSSGAFDKKAYWDLNAIVSASLCEP